MTNFNRIFAALLFGLAAVHSDASRAQAIVLDGNGTALGILLQANNAFMGALSIPHTSISSPTNSYWIINEKSYQFLINWPMFDFETDEALPNAVLDGPSTLSYETSDCTGQPFVVTRHSGIVFSLNRLFGSENEPETQAIYYVPREESLQKRSFLSRRESTTAECESLSLTYNFSGRAYLNDPSETGFTDPTPPMPIQLRSEIDPALARCVFRDGFECEA